MNMACTYAVTYHDDAKCHGHDLVALLDWCTKNRGGLDDGHAQSFYYDQEGNTIMYLRSLDTSAEPLGTRPPAEPPPMTLMPAYNDTDDPCHPNGISPFCLMGSSFLVPAICLMGSFLPEYCQSQTVTKSIGYVDILWGECGSHQQQEHTGISLGVPPNICHQDPCPQLHWLQKGLSYL
jgi:hypothetical protein